MARVATTLEAGPVSRCALECHRCYYVSSVCCGTSRKLSETTDSPLLARRAATVRRTCN
jgi:hypothetical protein